MTDPENAPSASPVEVRFKTPFGAFELALAMDKAPITAANFVGYVTRGDFDGASFYRTVRKDNWSAGREMSLVQGGLLVTAPERMGAPIPHESSRETGLFHREGAISMARFEPGTATSEFFICMSACPVLDPTETPRSPHDGHGFSVFGHVTAGMNVLRRIQAQPTMDDAPSPVMARQMLAEAVLITEAHFLQSTARANT